MKWMIQCIVFELTKYSIVFIWIGTIVQCSWFYPCNQWKWCIGHIEKRWWINCYWLILCSIEIKTFSISIDTWKTVRWIIDSKTWIVIVQIIKSIIKWPQNSNSYKFSNIKTFNVSNRFLRVWQYDPVHISGVHWQVFGVMQVPPLIQLELQIAEIYDNFNVI